MHSWKVWFWSMHCRKFESSISKTVQLWQSAPWAIRDFSCNSNFIPKKISFITSILIKRLCVHVGDAQWEKSELDNWSILNQTLTAYFQPCVLLSICCLIRLKIPLSLTNKIVRLLNPCGRKSVVCSITKQNKTQPDISTSLLGFFHSKIRW